MKKISFFMTLLAALTLSSCATEDKPSVEPEEPIVPDFQEKQIYTTDFSDWTKASASQTESIIEQKTKYSNEALTFTLFNTAVDPAGTNSKFNNGDPLGWLQAAKAEDPYILTSTLASVTKVRYVHAATGSKRGWKMEAKGEGDADWVVISESVADPAGWCEVNAEVNRKNVQLRWTNLNASQNAYMFQLDIYGEVNMAGSPALASFKVNGTPITVGEVFDANKDGDMEATIEISKKEKMISKENPISDIVADYGKVGFVTYEPTETGCKVVIPVTARKQTLNYIVNIVPKPDFTLTYIDADGKTELGKQTVEKDAKIEAFGVTDDKVTVASGKKFRGWAIATTGSKNRKYTVEDVITADANLYALVTDIEVASATARYEYALNDQYFYAEDHEAFTSVGNGKFHDGQHGWSFAQGDQVKLTMGGKGYIKLGLCQYSASGEITLTDAKGNVVDKVEAKAATDGAAAILNYNGEAGDVTLNFPGVTYIHNIAIINMKEAAYDKVGDWYIVKAGDANSFITTLEVALGETSADKRTYIFLPDGTYDLGEKVLTQISGQNISLIGQSMDNTIIVNAPPVANEGIGTTATLLNTSTNLYMQDLTLKNALDYFGAGSAGRAVCLQDKGKRTICKNVKLLSYQDTYYSNSNTQFYWETSEIHGVVDYICGGGDVFFNECKLVNESRSTSPKSGSVTIAAPYTDASNTYGYVFWGCTIENLAKNFNFGRAWGGVSRLAYINTIINQPDEIINTRFTLAGMNVVADKFVEFNSVDTNGSVVSPASNILTFTKDKNTKQYETILTAAEADAYKLEKVFTNWTPKAFAAQAAAPVVTVSGNTISWKAVEGASAYAVFNGGKFVTITTGTSYTASGAGNFTVRAANQMGGFGPAAQ